MGKEWLAYNLLNFTVSYGGVEQVFRGPPASPFLACWGGDLR